MLIYTKSSVQKGAFCNPVEVIEEAVLRAAKNGSDPIKEVTAALTSAGVKVVDFRGLFGSPPEHLKKPSAAEFEKLRDSISRAFAKLAKQGFFAVENFGHCWKCAGGKVEKEAQAKKCRKRVSYTTFEYAQMEEIGVCTIRYGYTLKCKTEAAQHERTRRVGNEVAHALKEEGLTVEWDGDPEVAIRVKLKEA